MMYGSIRRSKRLARAQEEEQKPSSLYEIPDECLVEVFRSLDLDVLLSCGYVCKRWQQIALDESLWKGTRFTACKAELLLRHFHPEWSTRNKDHTGIWMKCTRFLGQVCCTSRHDVIHPTPLKID